MTIEQCLSRLDKVILAITEWISREVRTTQPPEPLNPADRSIVLKDLLERDGWWKRHQHIPAEVMADLFRREIAVNRQGLEAVTQKMIALGWLLPCSDGMQRGWIVIAPDAISDVGDTPHKAAE
jgi:hypothetical protein